MYQIVMKIQCGNSVYYSTIEPELDTNISDAKDNSRSIKGLLAGTLSTFVQGRCVVEPAASNAVRPSQCETTCLNWYWLLTLRPA